MWNDAIMKKMFVMLLISCLTLTMISCGASSKEETKQTDNSDNDKEEEIIESEDVDLSGCVFNPYNEEYLKRLKNEYHLDELVKDCKTQLDQVAAVTAWVTSLWEHDGENEPEQDDPLFILDKVTKEGENYRCVEYGIVISGCLDALGFTSRTIALKTEDVETRKYGAGHVATEVYLSDYQKWVFVDGQWGAIPIKDGIPLNAYEFGQAIMNKDSQLTIMWEGNQSDTSQQEQEYYDWISEYLYYLDYTYYQPVDQEGYSDPVYRACRGVCVMYVPKGGKKITVFQRKYDLNVDIYTSDIDDFYSIPDQALQD